MACRWAITVRHSGADTIIAEHDFFAEPILNSPYEEPSLHHQLNESGQPTNSAPVRGRRKSSLYSPVPKPKRGKSADQQMSLIEDQVGLLDPHNIINEIREHMKSWRTLPNPTDWGVTPTTQRLLSFWRDPANFPSIRPFFCQLEAVETVIWLSEVARKTPRYANIWNHIEQGNEAANPEILRLALKMATGAGKTTVMAMLIAWQTLNAVRAQGSKQFTRGFLIIAPGITIKDRLRVLQPGGTDNYYATRGLVPSDMLHDLQKAKVVITNYHAFQRRETTSLSKGTRGALEGWRGEDVRTKETEGEMLRRALGDLMGMKNILVINDEAHHCYRENPAAQEKRSREEKKENEAARLWINGIEALQRHLGLLGHDAKKKRTRTAVAGVIDLSATPFFLKGSGFPEAALFPWTVTDFSLMDAIECGIVKLPRVPILDNLPTADGKPIYRDLWKHVGKKLPKKGRSKGGADGRPEDLPPVLQTALNSLYSHYEKTDAEWKSTGIEVPPVFIVVCNNTATSQLVHDWIAGYEVPETDERPSEFVPANLKLFSNFDDNQMRLPKPNTFLIDSAQFDSGDAVSTSFKAEMAPEIEQFKRQYPNQKVDDELILREVMNTIGEKGKLGESIRCVVSVSMLTEGWDTNTVTHIFGLRAFGTMLLSEQVVGRGLRRVSYDLNDKGHFDVEYADIMGIPFDFIAEPRPAPVTAPKPVTRIAAVKERAALEIRFPRVAGYRTELPDQRIEADFTEDSTLELTPELVGPTSTLMSGIVGEQVSVTPQEAYHRLQRPSTLSMHISKRLLSTRFRHPDTPGLPMNLFVPVQRIVRRWLDEGYLVCKGGAVPGMLAYEQLADMAADKVFLAYERANQRLSENAPEKIVRIIPDPYNPEGSTRHVAFLSSKSVFSTDPAKSHVSHVVEDSTWEAEMARVVEAHPKVISYVKNQGLGLEVPYRKSGAVHRYIPDFIVRLDTGDEPLNLIMEVKGYRDGDAVIKADTIKTLWIPGVNASGKHGRWAFAELTDVFDMERAFGELLNEFSGVTADVSH